MYRTGTSRLIQRERELEMVEDCNKRICIKILALINNLVWVPDRHVIAEESSVIWSYVTILEDKGDAAQGDEGHDVPEYHQEKCLPSHVD